MEGLTGRHGLTAYYYSYLSTISLCKLRVKVVSVSLQELRVDHYQNNW